MSDIAVIRGDRQRRGALGGKPAEVIVIYFHADLLGQTLPASYHKQNYYSTYVQMESIRKARL
jgi:hypothetical protein